MRVEVGESAARAPTSKTAATADLLLDRTPRNMAELSWRIGVPVSALLLSLVAVPLSFVNPRAGRSMNLVLALLVYMSYSNMLSLTQAWIAQSRVSFAGAFAVHALMAVALVLMFYRRIMPFAFLRRGR
jgi:lipopolysaccharide export system permease protein